MIFKTEKEAIEWLADAGISFECTVKGVDGYTTLVTPYFTQVTEWAFSLPKKTYTSEPLPMPCNIHDQDENAFDKQSEQATKRRERHRPKTFLDAVNLLAERFTVKPTEC